MTSKIEIKNPGIKPMKCCGGVFLHDKQCPESSGYKKDLLITTLLQTGAPAQLVSRNLEVIEWIAEFADQSESVFRAEWSESWNQLAMRWILKLKRQTPNRREKKLRITFSPKGSCQWFEGTVHSLPGTLSTTERTAYGNLTRADLEGAFNWLHNGTIKNR